MDSSRCGPRPVGASVTSEERQRTAISVVPKRLDQRKLVCLLLPHIVALPIGSDRRNWRARSSRPPWPIQQRQGRASPVVSWAAARESTLIDREPKPWSHPDSGAGETNPVGPDDVSRHDQKDASTVLCFGNARATPGQRYGNPRATLTLFRVAEPDSSVVRLLQIPRATGARDRPRYIGPSTGQPDGRAGLGCSAVPDRQRSSRLASRKAREDAPDCAPARCVTPISEGQGQPRCAAWPRRDGRQLVSSDGAWAGKRRAPQVENHTPLIRPPMASGRQRSRGMYREHKGLLRCHAERIARGDGVRICPGAGDGLGRAGLVRPDHQ